jgi:hypothetical protein
MNPAGSAPARRAYGSERIPALLDGYAAALFHQKKSSFAFLGVLCALAVRKSALPLMKKDSGNA